MLAFWFAIGNDGLDPFRYKGSRPSVLRTVGDAPTLWESILPSAVLGMPEELERVDRVLGDPRFLERYRSFFHEWLGRPSIPIETYLRLMFLKYRYRLGFESLCREVADSISWQRFARIPLGGRVPHPTTLMKITSRCGEAAVNELNEALLVKAAEAMVLKTNRVRADTTVIAANVAYPSDSSLLTKGVAKMAGAVKRLQAMGLATRTQFADRTRAARRRAHSINANLRRRNDDKLAEVRRINGELARIATRAVRQVTAVVGNARRALHRLGSGGSGKARALVDQLARTAARVAKIAEQCQQRIAGTTPDGGTRIVSLHDPDARPIAKGRLGRPVEFGYKAQIVDNEDGVSWTTPSSRATRPMRPCSNRRSRASPDAPDEHRGRSPPIAATANSASRTICTPPGCAMSYCPARANRPRRGVRLNSAARSRRWSAGEPAAKEGSAPSNATTGAAEPAWTPSPAPEPGAGTASSPTTSSRSAGSSNETRKDDSRSRIARDRDPLTANSSGRSS
jgi:transposase, IS5 family